MASVSPICGTVSSDGRWDNPISLIFTALDDLVEEGVLEVTGYIVRVLFSAACSSL